MKLTKKTALLNHIKFAEGLKNCGMTQEEFAEEIDISDRYVRDLTTKDKNVSVSMAYSISRIFGVSIEDMLIIVKDVENAEADCND